MPKDTTTPEPFEGFDIPETNWFRMPNSWTNITAEITSLAEIKIVEYVLRHTWGFQEFGLSKRISIDEFMHGRKKKDGSRMDKGTGLSNKGVIKGIKRAVEHGYLTEQVDARDKARVRKSYCLKMRAAEDADPNEGTPKPGVDNPEPARESEPDSQNSTDSDVNAEQNRDVQSNRNNVPSDVNNVHPMNNLHSPVNNLHSRYEETSQRTEKTTLVPHSQKATISGINQQETNGSINDKNSQPPGLASHLIKTLSDVKRPREKIEYIAQEISRRTKTPKSLKWWCVVASKFEEAVIWRNLAGLEEDENIKSLGAVFTARMGQEAARQTHKMEQPTVEKQF